MTNSLVVNSIVLMIEIQSNTFACLTRSCDHRLPTQEASDPVGYTSYVCGPAFNPTEEKQTCTQHFVINGGHTIGFMYVFDEDDSKMLYSTVLGTHGNFPKPKYFGSISGDVDVRRVLFKPLNHYLRINRHFPLVLLIFPASVSLFLWLCRHLQGETRLGPFVR